MQQVFETPSPERVEPGSGSVATDAITAAHAGDALEAGKEGAVEALAKKPVEIGGREGPEPTRFGDWEKAGRCIDF